MTNNQKVTWLLVACLASAGSCLLVFASSISRGNWWLALVYAFFIVINCWCAHYWATQRESAPGGRSRHPGH